MKFILFKQHKSLDLRKMEQKLNMITIYFVKSIKSDIFILLYVNSKQIPHKDDSSKLVYYYYPIFFKNR